jgi:hypothetical protein
MLFKQHFRVMIKSDQTEKGIIMNVIVQNVVL